jgi:hypothetical protein
MKSNHKRVLCGLLLLMLALPLAAQTSNRDMATTAMSHDAFQLTPAAPSTTRSILVDATTAFSVYLLAPSQTLTVSIVGPDHTRYTVGAAPTATFESGFFPIDSVTTKPGASYLASITNPMTGTWTLEVSESATLTAPLDVLTKAFFNNSTWLVLAGGGESFPVGADVRLALVGFDGTAKIKPLSINASLFRPFDPTFTPTAVTFRDDGVGADETANDGIYEAFVNPGTPGSYQVQVDATGNASSGAFARSTATEFAVVPHNALITGFTDRALDDNFDGLYDRIGIRPSANIAEAGTYDVSVRLRASNGHEVQRSVRQTFGVGTGSVEVAFSAASLTGDLGVDGPWNVVEVRYFEEVGGDLVPADIRYDLGSTAAYTLGQLQHDRLRLNGTGTAVGLDFDGNGKFDYLKVSVGIDADFAGYYQYSVSLTDRNGKELGFRTSYVFFSAGSNKLELFFAGYPIGQNGVDGPYFLSNLIMSNFAGSSLVAPDAFTTQAFTASQFEGFRNDTTPPTVVVTATPNVLWPVDHKMVEIIVNVTATDDQDANPVVSLVGITSNQGQNTRGDGNTSTDILVQNGRIFLRAERSGPNSQDRVYTITYSARDASGNVGFGTAIVTVPHDQGHN